MERSVTTRRMLACQWAGGSSWLFAVNTLALLCMRYLKLQQLDSISVRDDDDGDGDDHSGGER